MLRYQTINYINMEVVKSYTVDLSSLEIKDLAGNITVKSAAVEKALGESIYSGMIGLGWLNIAQSLYAFKPVEMSEPDISELLSFIKSKRCDIVIMVKVPLIAYLENLIS